MDKRKEYIEIGRIIAAHGIKGFMKMEPWFDSAKIISNLRYIYFKENDIKKERIEKISNFKNYYLIKLQETNAVEKTFKYIRKIIYAKRKDLNLDIEHGEILIQDLIGMRICDIEKEKKIYGKIVDVLKTGANDVYIIKDENNKERLIPVIEEVIKKKDYEKGEIYIKVLKGLFDV